MISGTTTNPNQLTKKADKRVIAPNKAADNPHGISVKSTYIPNRIVITKAIIANVIHPITGHKVRTEIGK